MAKVPWKGDSQIRPIDIEKLAELYGKDGFLGKENEEKILSKYQAEKLLEDEEYKKQQIEVSRYKHSEWSRIRILPIMESGRSIH